MGQLIKAEQLSKHDIENGCFAAWRVPEEYAGFARYKFDAYMEAGLNQEQIYQLLADRRINLAEKKVVEYRDYLSLGTLAELTALSKARDEGRVLPCKVGDTVWNIRGVFLYFPEPKEEVVNGFVTSDYGVIATFQSGYRSPIDRFGNSIFLSRAEAEAGLVGVCALWLNAPVVGEHQEDGGQITNVIQTESALKGEVDHETN